MVEIDITYEGGLRTAATHGPSGDDLKTDAPVDNQGRGESFSPTDLVATAVGSCMLTIMGILAEREGIPLEGSKVKVGKHMSADTPRRISKLDVQLQIPLAADHPSRKKLEAGAMACPVKKSIHPDIELNIDFQWVGEKVG